MIATRLDRRERIITRRTNNVYQAQKRKAKKLGRLLDYDLELLRRAVNYALEHNCRYCGQPMDASDWSVDHEQPISRGGTMEFQNIVIVHRRCNEIKNDMDDTEFQRLMDLLEGFSEPSRKNVLARLRAGGKAIRR